MQEPLWRQVLCWGAVVSFFVMPSLLFILVFYNAIRREGFLTPEEIHDFQALSPYQATLAALVVGLAGLNTWDKRTTSTGPK